MWKLLQLVLGLVSGGFGKAADTYGDIKKTQITEATKQAQSTDAAVREIGVSALANLAASDQATSKRDIAWGAYSPLALVTAAIAALFAFHGTGVVLDSMPLFGHLTGTWKVRALPGMWEQTEHVVLQSLFYGASTAVAGGALIKAIKR